MDKSVLQTADSTDKNAPDGASGFEVVDVAFGHRYDVSYQNLDRATYDEWGLWSDVLTQEEVTALYAGVTFADVPKDNLFAYYDFEQTDTTATNKALTTVQTTGVVAGGDFEAGKLSNALISPTLTIESSVLPSETDDFTIMGWVKSYPVQEYAAEATVSVTPPVDYADFVNNDVATNLNLVEVDAAAYNLKAKNWNENTSDYSGNSVSYELPVMSDTAWTMRFSVTTTIADSNPRGNAYWNIGFSDDMWLAGSYDGAQTNDGNDDLFTFSWHIGDENVGYAVIDNNSRRLTGDLDSI